jgi:pre-mRNA cleavage complex 2 protein Pcf11
MFIEQADGKLLLSEIMRKEMQNILDELQKDITNELEKVSLERLADINQDLLGNIKKAAEDNLRSHAGSSTSSNMPQASIDSQELPSFFIETRSAETMKRAKAWQELKWDPLTKTHEVISKLQHAVRHGTSSSVRYTEQEASNLIQFYAAASATCSVVTAALEQLKNQEDRKEHKKRLSFPGSDNGTMGTGGSFLVDKKEFTNEGIKEKNTAIIGLLYEIGLPFVSSADGRRFRTEIELSNHLDSLFKRNQLEKSMTRTEERGWYPAENVWTGEKTILAAAEVKEGTQPENTVDEFDPEHSTMPADESRDRCVICGINFKMFFDNDDGIYRYSNCREIEVLNDDAAEKHSEEMLVHVTCWRGLGSPEVLTMDQALQETLRDHL